MRSNAGLHRFSVFTAVCTFLLIIAGGLVTSTDSGLSVPDWPDTYGHFMFAYPVDQMVGGIFYEHSHRMIASIVGLLTAVLAVWLWKRDERRWVRRLGLAAFGAVVLQGLLGGLTVLFLLPVPISVGHATLAQTFFVLTASIALVTSPRWKNAGLLPDTRQGLSVFRLCLATTAAIYIQLILGALMRHTQSGLAVPDFPLAYGQLLPSLSPDALARYNAQLISSDLRLAADGPITAAQILIHMSHRLWALVVATLIVWTSVRLVRLRGGQQRGTAAVFLGLLLLQVSLGAFTVLSAKAVDVTTAHVATGALILVVSALATLRTARLSGLRYQRFVPAMRPRGVPA